MWRGWCSPCQQHHWKAVDVRFPSLNQEHLKSKFILLLVRWFFSAQLQFCSVKIGANCSFVPLITSSSSQLCSSSSIASFLFNFMVPVEMVWNGCFNPNWVGLIWFLLHWTFLGLCDQEWAKPSGCGWVVDVGTCCSQPYSWLRFINESLC